MTVKASYVLTNQLGRIMIWSWPPMTTRTRW